MSHSSVGETPILRSFQLTQLDENRWEAPSVPNERRPIVFGGQLLGQTLLAAASAVPEKEVRSLQVIFSRAGSVSKPVQLDTTVLQNGRSLGTVSIIAAQEGRILAPCLALMDAGEEDVIRHQPDMPTVTDPDDIEPAQMMLEEGTEIRIVDNVDLRTSAATGPPELNVWVRFSPTGEDQSLNRALVGWWTDPFLIGSAMRPHDGVGQSHAHETISTGVLNHTLVFHEDVDAEEWHLIANRSTYAGRGRTYGVGNVFARDGRLVASFAQENMIRHFRDNSQRGTAAGAM